MTREEAIKWLIKPARTSTDIGEIKAKEIEAYNVAIEALSQPVVCKDYCIDDDHIYCSPKVAERVVEALQAKTDGDLISRKWMLEVYGDYIGDDGEPRYHVPLEVVRQNIKDAPSADRPTGEWKEVYAETDYSNGWIEFSCECCEYRHGLESGEYGWSYGEPIPWKFCPNCGAKMEGGDAE